MTEKGLINIPELLTGGLELLKAESAKAQPSTQREREVQAASLAIMVFAMKVGECIMTDIRRIADAAEAGGAT